MNVAIVGAGRVGGALGRGLAAAGHTVHYALRDPSRPVDPALVHPGATTGGAAEVVARSEVVVLATPWDATSAALASVPDFGGRPLLDVTNPIGPGFALTHGHTDSGGEQVQRWAPTARVVKVFNTTGQENLGAPVLSGGPALMLASGDDPSAVAVALGLARDLGFEAHAFGGLANARLLEPYAMVWIKLALQYGLGRGFALGVLRR